MTQPVETPSTRRSSIAALLAIAVLGIGVVYALSTFGVRRSAPDPAVARALAEYVMAHGRPASIPTGPAGAFGIPTDGSALTCQQILVTVEDGQPAVTYDADNPAPLDLAVGVRGIQVCKWAESDRIDNFLLNAVDADKAYYFLTGPDAKLRKVIRMNETPALMLHGEKPFAVELAFWRDWLARVQQ